MKGKTPGCGNGESQIERRHSDGHWDDNPFHRGTSRNCWTSAIDSVLSHVRGPTARPSGCPFDEISTDVGNPRTMKARESC